MTTTLERPPVRERPPETRTEPRGPESPPPDKRDLTPRRPRRRLRWTMVGLLLVLATGVAVLALRDGGGDTPGTDTIAQLSPMEEINLIRGFGAVTPAVAATVQLSPMEEINLIRSYGEVTPVAAATVQLSPMEEINLIRGFGEATPAEEPPAWVGRVR